MNFSWLMKYFKKQKHRTRSNLKIIWVKVKAREKRREGLRKRLKAYERSKNIKGKNNSTPTNFTLALSRTSSLNNTTKIISSYATVS